MDRNDFLSVNRRGDRDCNVVRRSIGFLSLSSVKQSCAFKASRVAGQKKVASRHAVAYRTISKL